MKRKTLMLLLPFCLCLLSYHPPVPGSNPVKQQQWPCNATTSFEFSFLGSSGSCTRVGQLYWPDVPGASSYTVRIMYHGNTCTSIPSGVWITYSNVYPGMYLNMPNCFSLDLEIITNCGEGESAGSSLPFESSYTDCF